MKKQSVKKAPFFSIVIPSYKSALTIHNPLLSLAAQLYRDFEVVVVDDCSPNRSADRAAIDRVVKSLPFEDQFVFVKTPINGGPGVARQVGLDHARGQYVMFLDADDALASAVTLFNIRQGIAQYGEPEILTTQFIEILGDGNSKLHTPEDIAWVHGKIYKISFLRELDIHFPTIRYTEDGAFNMVAFPLAQRVIQLPGFESYIWIKNPNSTVNSQDYVQAIMQNDYPQGFVFAYRELGRIGATASFQKRYQTPAEAVKYISDCQKRLSVGGSLSLYLYYQAVKLRTSHKTEAAIERACAYMVAHNRVVSTVDEVTDRDQWVMAIQLPLVDKIKGVIGQEPLLPLNRSYVDWLNWMDRLNGGTGLKTAFMRE